jgi:hypothetical protein
MRTRLALPAAALAAAVRTTDRGPVDPVRLLLAIHEASSIAELAAARLAAIRAISAVGGRVWAGGCPVTAGADAVALGCMVGRLTDTDTNPVNAHNAHVDEPDDQGRVHLKHQPLHFHTRIAWLTARTESRLAAAQEGDDAA